MKSIKNKNPKIMSTYIYSIYNNGSFVIIFIKFFMHYILSVFSYFWFFVFFFVILTLFNFSPSSTIVFLVQSFIPSIIFFFNFHLIFFRFNFFFPLYLLKFYSFTLFNISSTYILPISS